MSIIKRILSISFFCLSLLSLKSQKNIDSLAFSQIIDDALTNPAFILIGEAHEIAGTHELQIYMISQFVARGYNTLILECGVAEAEIFNQYLSSGDPALLDHTRASGSYYRTFIESLRNTAPGLIIKGVDFERAVCLAFHFRQWENQLSNPLLLQMTEAMRSIKGSTRPTKMKEALQTIKKEYETHKDLVDQQLKESSLTLEQIVHNPVFQADFNFSSKKRDQAILQNLTNLPTSILEHSVLIFGSNHFTNEKYFWKEFSLTQTGKLHAFMILYSYFNCKNYMRKKLYSSEKPLSDYWNSPFGKQAKIDFKVARNTLYGHLHDDQKFLIARLAYQ